MPFLRAAAFFALIFPWLALGQAGSLDIEQRLTPEQQHATGIDALSPAQLKLLNQLLRDQPDRIAPAAGRSSAQGSDVARTSIADTGHAAPAATSTPRDAAAPTPGPMFIGLDDQPIKTRVVGSVSGWAPGSEFVLANGQRWKVLKGEVKLPSPRENPAVVVLPGIAGRWFLQVDENLPSARVYRIQ